jgi:hypothetical protein
LFEQRTHPIIPFRKFLKRILKSAVVALLTISAALYAGMVGYHFLAGLDWLDSFLNASMILGGMGPVNELHSSAAKLFAGCYALFSGLLFIVIMGIIFAPILHRILHHFHMESEKK